MVAFWFLLAQLPSPDPISGGAGWLGAGLLGLVLGWLLLVHLPSKDKQTKELVDGMLNRHEVMEREQRQTFRESLDQVVNHCKEEFATILAHSRKTMIRPTDSDG